MILWTLYRKELAAIFHSGIAYVVLLACALTQGVMFVIAVNFLNDYGIKQYTILQMVFNGFFFWLVLLMIAPVIMMRSFSEEWKMGTMEMLLTAPVRDWEVVFSKYFAGLTFFGLVWLPTVLNLILLSVVQGSGGPPLYSITTVLSFLIILLFGILFVAVGLFASMLTKNQIIAAVVAFVLIFLFFSLGILSYLRFDPSLKWLQNGLTTFSCLEHADLFQRGIFDTRPLVLYPTVAAFFLLLTKAQLKTRRLRG